ncbi:MAG: hypothetical protein CL583_04870 [Alteromonadaceae bacterium]|nr:hypothetical protein [Alteromonadaceae bacterium]|tara:strand:- start:242 stop:1153 length:912 start_codon:yes stop_codon:yes gene_type:complete
MDEELALFLKQRDTLLASDEGDLVSLKRHDRKLVVAMAQCACASPLTQPPSNSTDQALIEGLQAEFSNTVVILEARARVWLGELGRVQALLLPRPEASQAAWWLAAHYPALALPAVFPDLWKSQVWAAWALLRRDRCDLLPEPWLSWVEVLKGRADAKAVAQSLWQISSGNDWERWFAPLLTTNAEDNATNLVNWLAGRAEDSVVVRAMGLSCQSRFLPWLASMRHDPRHTEGVLREIRWLVGDQQARHEGQQCWGEPLTPVVLSKLFRTVPLSFRDRLWQWCRNSTEGAASSLQGGRWCAGS